LIEKKLGDFNSKSIYGKILSKHFRRQYKTSPKLVIIASAKLKSATFKASSHLKQELDEDPGGAGGVLLVEPDGVEDEPADGVGEEEVREDLGHVPQLANLKPEFEKMNVHFWHCVPGITYLKIVGSNPTKWLFGSIAMMLCTCN
jgi:hypothetical protein